MSESVRGRTDIERKLQIVQAFVELGSSVSALTTDVLHEHGVPASMASTLWALAPGTEPSTMRELATRLRCDPSTVSIAADKLQDLGLVAREAHPDDRRKRILTLTPQGRDLWDLLRHRLHASGIMADLDAREQQTLLALLDRMRTPHRAR